MEPRIWSHITDALPDDHPLMQGRDDSDGIFCASCRKMLHDFAANECMRTWTETGKGNYCLQCFAVIDAEASTIDAYALPVQADQGQ